MIFEISDDELLPHALWIVLVKYRADWRCEECAAPPSGRARSLQAHHLDLDGKNHRLANGRALCAQCHSSLHSQIRAERATAPFDVAMRVVELRRRGLSYEQVAAYLNAERVPAPTGRASWSRQAVRKTVARHDVESTPAKSSHRFLEAGNHPPEATP